MSLVHLDQDCTSAGSRAMHCITHNVMQQHRAARVLCNKQRQRPANARLVKPAHKQRRRLAQSTIYNGIRYLRSEQTEAAAHEPLNKPHYTAVTPKSMPTLRQTWPRLEPRPQGAFEMSMIKVSCNSHYFTQFAALFIDARAE